MSRRSSYQYPWFHERIMNAYYASGMTVAQLSERSGVARSYLYRILFELCWPSIPTMFKLEAALGLEQGELVRPKKMSQLRDK